MTVLRDGRNACASQPMAGVTRARLVRWMIGRDETAPAPVGRRAPPSGTPALELRGIATALGHRGHRPHACARARSSGSTASSVPAGASSPKPSSGAERITGGELRVEGRAGSDRQRRRGAGALAASAISARTARARG